jgi:hypothetical protein
LARGNQPILILERIQDGKSCRRAEKAVAIMRPDSRGFFVSIWKNKIIFTAAAGPVLAE